ELAAEDFEPWVDDAEARREGITTAELGAKTAAKWTKGLASWGLDGGRIRELRDGTSLRVYTPGSTAGAPLNLIGDLQPPPEADAETIREAAESLASALLTLADIESDPLTTPEHILLATLIERGWTAGEVLSLETLIGGVQTPPFRKLGVFEVDAFVPPAQRMKLALRLNGLVASPSFAAWRSGDPLDIDRLLWAPDGRPRASVIQLAHLSEPERIFVVTLLLSRAITWMRRQPGTSDLRAMIYIDELFGFAPPTANPPSKTPLLTLFKQARAHGLGVVVSTQNPVDMDYKLMSNAGTWMMGRLQTERDKARVIEALRSADGSVDVRAWDARLGGLGKRQFVLKRTRSPDPELFTTRWAMSYLRGPVTRAELDLLPPETIAPESDSPEAAQGGATDGAAVRGAADPVSPTSARHAAPPASPHPGSGAGAAPAAALPLADDESPLMPKIADGVRVTWLDPAAPWAAKLGLGAGARLEAGLAGRVRMLFDETKADLRHEIEWEMVFAPPLAESVQATAASPVDFDERDFRDSAPAGVRYVIPAAPLDKKSFLNAVERALADRLHATLELKLRHNPTLKLYSRVGESEADFRTRCEAAAEDAADADAAKLRDRYEKKLDTARDQVERAERRLRELDVDVSSRRQQELVSGAGALIGAFLGGRRSTRSLSSIASRRSQTRRTEERRRSAEEKLTAEQEDVVELEQELAEDLQAIWDRWQTAAGEIEIVEVGLEKNDIDVSDLHVFWAARTE
ncbi:MAG: ATP-binding protein, partial [Gemmatimonadetes bacterium]|nr:ATP-binding protein [Gemmatimonadota bacterium]